MLTPEEKAREKLFKKVMKYALIGSSFSIGTTVIAAVIFKDFYLFLAYIFCIFLYGTMVFVNYFFIKKKISLKQSTYILIFLLIFGITVLMYIAGGFSGAMISAYIFGLIMVALLLEQKEALFVSVLITIIYLTFMIGESYNIIRPLIVDVTVIKYSKAIIDMLAFFVVTFLVTIITKNTRDSIRFYRLRTERLGKIRKRLEFLVKRRTRQLEQSNRIIRKRTEELEKAQASLKKGYKELKKLDVKKDEFISIAAHELKTPLTAIGGYSQLLQDERVINDKEKRKQFLTIMDKESRRLSNLVTGILNLSRVDLGVMKYYIGEVDIYEVMKDLEDEFIDKIREKGLKYEVKLERNLPKIKTDRDKLLEILTNLVSNAFKYTLKGKITVEVKKQGRYIQFSVSDKGVGIAKSHHKKIFERFSPVDSSLRREVGGTGLGLSICKEYVEKMGGKIRVKSRLGRGSTFYVKLPVESKIKSSPEKTT